ncbi:MAG: patatin family protein [Rikenellaceae bacterium]
MSDRALVLEGGGMRGIFTAGVLDSFLDKDINFQYIIGVSAGCSNALNFISKQHGRALYIHTTLLDNYKYIGLRSWLKTGEIVDNDLLYNKLLQEIYPFDFESFSADKATFESVATNALTGDACYMSKPTDIEQLKLNCMASGSLPIVNHAVVIDGIPMVDGGVADSIPIERALSLGYKDIVVVLTQERGFRKGVSRFKIPQFACRKYPKVIEMLNTRATRYNQQIELVEQLEQRGEIRVIRPTQPLQVGRLTTDTRRLKDLYDKGYTSVW